MCFKNVEELKALAPIKEGNWNQEALKEYLIMSCHRDFKGFVDTFMERYQKDEKLADLLFEFLLNEDYDGSDSQMGAAKYIARLDKELLRNRKEKLLQAQQNEVYWKRPFRDEEFRKWL